MKRKADRIDKMNKIRVSSCGFPEILTLVETVSHLSLSIRLTTTPWRRSLILETPRRRHPEPVLSIL